MTEVTRMRRLIFIKYEVFPQCLIRKVYYTASVISMMFLIIFFFHLWIIWKNIWGIWFALSVKNRTYRYILIFVKKIRSSFSRGCVWDFRTPMVILSRNEIWRLDLRQRSYAVFHTVCRRVFLAKKSGWFLGNRQMLRHLCTGHSWGA